MNRNIFFFFFLVSVFACTNSQEKNTINLTEKEEYDFINNIYKDELTQGFVFLYDQPITTTFPEDSILVLNNITFKIDSVYKNSNYNKWKETLLDESFFLIETFGNYESDTLFKKNLMLSISHPVIDISGKFILITEEIFDYGYIIDRNTYIYTKDRMDNWNIYYKLHIGIGYDEGKPTL